MARSVSSGPEFHKSNNAKALAAPHFAADTIGGITGWSASPHLLKSAALPIGQR